MCFIRYVLLFLRLNDRIVQHYRVHIPIILTHNYFFHLFNLYLCMYVLLLCLNETLWFVVGSCGYLRAIPTMVP